MYLEGDLKYLSKLFSLFRISLEIICECRNFIRLGEAKNAPNSV